MHIIAKLISATTNFLVKTPLYPYWLIFKVADQGNQKLLKQSRGLVLNVGSGATDKRTEIESNPKVIDYKTLDYPGWKGNWQALKKDSARFGKLSRILYRRTTPKPDIWGDGYHLPFQDETLDTIVSLGVIEHISDHVAFLQEKYRVLKPNGILLLTSPLIYQSHGGVPSGKDDFIRLTESGLLTTLKNIGFETVEVKPYGGFGTMLSQLLHSRLIKFVGNLNKKTPQTNAILLLAVPFLLFFFLISNLVCYLLDQIDQDPCYTAGFFVTAYKSKKISYSLTENKKTIFDLLVCPYCHLKLDKKSACHHCHKSYQKNQTLCFV